MDLYSKLPCEFIEIQVINSSYYSLPKGFDTSLSTCIPLVSPRNYEFIKNYWLFMILNSLNRLAEVR